MTIVDKILKQQQHDRKMAEEARRSRYIGSEASNSSTTLVPQPVAPITAHADTSTLRSKSPTRRPGLPGGWEPASSPPPPALPQPEPQQMIQEMERIAQTNPHPELGPVNNLRNTLQNFTRKLGGHAQSLSQEIVRAGQSSQYVTFT